MPTVNPDSMSGNFCNKLRDWFETNFGQEADEGAMVQLAAEEGHVDAVVEYLLHVITTEDVLSRSIKALASIPAAEGVAWKDVVDEANLPAPDIIRIRSVMDGWPDNERLARGIMRLARRAIEEMDEGERPALWMGVLDAVRSA